MRTSKKQRHARADLADERIEEGLEEGQLRRLLTNTIDTIEDNKTQIFDIYQNTRNEVDEARDRLAELKKNVADTIARVDALAADEQRAKQKLAEVSRNRSSRSTSRSSARRSRRCAWSATSSRSACAISLRW